MPQTRRTNADNFDLATRLLRAQAAAEQEAVRHVTFLRRAGATLQDTAQAIGLDPANVKTWDAITMAYVLLCCTRALFERQDRMLEQDAALRAAACFR